MSTFRKIAALIIILVFFHIFVPINSYANPDEVTIKARTPVELMIIESLTSYTLNLNEEVSFEVSRDVVIDGKVVIKEGTPAIGTVTLVEQHGRIGKGGTIQISLDSTKAVDGQTILLRSTFTQLGRDRRTKSIVLSCTISPFFLLMKGYPAMIGSGTVVSAYTLQDVVVDIK